MTPARKAALQWFHDRGEIECLEAQSHTTFPGIHIVRRMLNEGQLWAAPKRGSRPPLVYSLTDKGRRDLHEAGR